jgi:hypothetical protein
MEVKQSMSDSMWESRRFWPWYDGRTGISIVPGTKNTATYVKQPGRGVSIGTEN